MLEVLGALALIFIFLPLLVAVVLGLGYVMLALLTGLATTTVLLTLGMPPWAALLCGAGATIWYCIELKE